MLLLTIAQYKFIVVGLIMVVLWQWIRQEIKDAEVLRDDTDNTLDKRTIIDKKGNIREIKTVYKIKK